MEAWQVRQLHGVVENAWHLRESEAGGPAAGPLKLMSCGNRSAFPTVPRSPTATKDSYTNQADATLGHGRPRAGAVCSPLGASGSLRTANFEGYQALNRFSGAASRGVAQDWGEAHPPP